MTGRDPLGGRELIYDTARIRTEDRTLFGTVG